LRGQLRRRGIKWPEDACGELGRADLVDELEYGVQVDVGVSGELGSEVWSESGSGELVATPRHDVS
jgi:hypothetical protein